MQALQTHFGERIRYDIRGPHGAIDHTSHFGRHRFFIADLVACVDANFTDCQFRALAVRSLADRWQRATTRSWRRTRLPTTTCQQSTRKSPATCTSSMSATRPAASHWDCRSTRRTKSSSTTGQFWMEDYSTTGQFWMEDY